MEGTTLGHYQIVEKIGEGAVGVVYRARDQHLERDVAVKILGKECCPDEPARSRFRTEALALSQLNHPNVATIYDFDSQDGTDFLVMEFLPGMTLEETIAPGPLAEKALILLAIQIAQGLESAHRQGVVHRDLKPANILIAGDGRPKVLDFGLATLQETTAAASVTISDSETTTRVGTPYYMAPEVLEGSVADRRSDIYALGVILFEMATGKRPFEGPTAMRVIYASVNEPAPAPRSIHPDISRALESIIQRAMARDPDERFQDAGEVVSSLKALRRGHLTGVDAPVAGRPRVRSLAVLPLTNLSGDPSQEYFADGLTEALIAELAKMEGFQVISRTSVMAYKGVRKPLPEIAGELNVDGVVEGSVLRSGDRVRITVQLILALTDTTIWGESYERELSDILTLQSEVARAVTEEIQGQLTPKSRERLERARPGVKPAAYEAYLRGRFHWNRRTEDALRQGIEYFNQAIKADPTYALAYVGLADAFNILGFYSYFSSGDTFPRAKAAALEALRMDPSLAEAHVSLGYATHFYDWNWKRAESEYQTALEQAPNYSLAHHWYYNYLVSMGRMDEALAEAQRAQELDPISLITTAGLGWVHYHRREFDSAVELSRKAIDLDPTFSMGWLWAGYAHQGRGDHENAVASYLEANTQSAGSPLTEAFLAQGLACAGRSAEAEKRLRNLVDATAQTRHVSPYLIAMIHLGLGDTDEAFRWLQKARQERSHWLVFLNVEPRLDPVRQDPRFLELRSQVGLDSTRLHEPESE